MMSSVVWSIPRRSLRLEITRPLVMGIVNLNDDSFCGDGTLDPVAAARQAARLLEAGADIIDIGAESARTNREAVPVEEELRRFRAFLPEWEKLAAAPPRLDDRQVHPPLLSINTWRPETVAEVLPLAGDLLNDMGALPTDDNARLAAEHGCSLLIMHSVGAPKQRHTDVRWDDVCTALDGFFEEKTALAERAGVPRESIVLDPGLDFAKQREDNLRILRHAGGLARFGCPVLWPVSRKTFIGETLGLPDPADRDAGTLAALTAAACACPGAIFRVHNAGAAARVVRVLDALALTFPHRPPSSPERIVPNFPHA